MNELNQNKKMNKALERLTGIPEMLDALIMILLD